MVDILNIGVIALLSGFAVVAVVGAANEFGPFDEAADAVGPDAVTTSEADPREPDLDTRLPVLDKADEREGDDDGRDGDRDRGKGKDKHDGEEDDERDGDDEEGEGD